MKLKQKQKKENSERWLLTYADLITLLLALFILLFAISNVDKEKYDELSASLSSSMGGGAGVLEGSNGVLESKGDSVVDLPTKAPTATPKPTKGASKTGKGDGEIAESITTQQDMKKFEQYINTILKDAGIESSTSTSMVDTGLVISFTNDVFFDSGQDELKLEMKKGLSEIATMLNKIDNSIVIEGHTDNVPIVQNSVFPSNWQLSAARAANVAQYLVDHEKVDGSRISAVGYGEYRPVASNNTMAGRSKNRRVDLIVLYDNSKEYNIK